MTAYLDTFNIFLAFLEIVGLSVSQLHTAVVLPFMEYLAQAGFSAVKGPLQPNLPSIFFR